MTPERLAEIEARAKAATTGPWYAEDVSSSLDGDEGYSVEGPEYTEDGNWTDSNAFFVAAAREDVPEICSALREAWDEVERLTRERDEQITACDQAEVENMSLKFTQTRLESELELLRGNKR